MKLVGLCVLVAASLAAAEIQRSTGFIRPSALGGEMGMGGGSGLRGSRQHVYVVPQNDQPLSKGLEKHRVHKDDDDGEAKGDLEDSLEEEGVEYNPGIDAPCRAVECPRVGNEVPLPSLSAFARQYPTEVWAMLDGGGDKFSGPGGDDFREGFLVSPPLESAHLPRSSGMPLHVQACPLSSARLPASPSQLPMLLILCQNPMQTEGT